MGPMSGWQIWTIIGVLLLVAEMFAPGFWLACVAIGCFVAGLAGLAPVGLTGQVIAFAVSTLASLVGIRPFLRRHFRLEPGTGVRTNVDALLGKTGVVTERIDAGGGEGGGGGGGGGGSALGSSHRRGRELAGCFGGRCGARAGNARHGGPGGRHHAHGRKGTRN